jgi:hypothetical protein
MEWYETPSEEREACGLAGREWALSDEANFTAEKMANSYIKATQLILENWKPIPRYKLYSVNDHIKRQQQRKTGIAISYDK